MSFYSLHFCPCLSMCYWRFKFYFWFHLGCVLHSSACTNNPQMECEYLLSQFQPALSVNSLVTCKNQPSFLLPPQYVYFLFLKFVNIMLCRFTNVSTLIGSVKSSFFINWLFIHKLISTVFIDALETVKMFSYKQYWFLRTFTCIRLKPWN